MQRRDDIWIPDVSLKKQDGTVDATELLTRGGFLRQAYSGIYHFLPLGLRVQEKLEKLIDHHMQWLKASKVSLSSISSQNLWDRSGRLSSGSELFKFSDRKDAKWLLSPTHEEEITSLVADLVHSPGQLPVRLYQISRKYRDEKRPRGGLLRGREFIMKDLYTFDNVQEEAHATYDLVRQAYRNFLNDLGISFIEARADSGNMGGNLSHEYHFPSSAGEDDVIHCTSCDYARNEEWVAESSYSVKPFVDGKSGQLRQRLVTASFVDKPKTALVKAIAPLKFSDGNAVQLNSYAIKAALENILEIDTGVEQAVEVFDKVRKRSSDTDTVYYVFDPAVLDDTAHAYIVQDIEWLQANNLVPKLVLSNTSSSDFSLLKSSTGDTCPQCKTGMLQVDKAIEIGHTFHLGTRYSSKLDLTVRSPQKDSQPVPVEMGCHGIGVTRLIAACAASLSDSTGLNWPLAIAPYEAVVVVDGNDEKKVQVAESLAESHLTGRDILIDDRKNVNTGYKLKDADLIGYPLILVVGKHWDQKQHVEIQCRRLNIKEMIPLADISQRAKGLFARL